jgi:uncharacterized protein (DUF885 family)
MPTDVNRADTADAAAVRLIGTIIDDLLERRPDEATLLGDHRFDDRLPDLSQAGQDAARQSYAAHLAALSDLDVDALEPQLRADVLALGNLLAARVFEIDELRAPSWDPMLANPGRALYALLARDFAPLPDRLRAVAARLAAVPETLATARATLGQMPRVYLETAIGQFAGTTDLVGGEIDRLLADLPALAAELAPVRQAALDALDAHRDWLVARLSDGERDGDFRDPRIGAERFAAKLSLTLDTEADADALLARAEADLEIITAEITELAARRAGVPASRADGETVRRMLDELAADAPDDDSILPMATDALAAQTAFVRERDLVTVYDDPFQVVVMPEVDRGVSVAYCDPPGVLETADLPTLIAVAPTPADWTPERVASFYREYNRHMVQDLMVHEAMPGHMVQLQHARRYAGRTPVRTAYWSGTFVEGWAVYAERLMVEAGYQGAGDPDALRAQQLKMRLRSTINAILDHRVHGRGMTEAEAMTLMRERGFQEEGEAAGKWRRACLDSTQLSTYYVGYTEVSDLIRDLRRVYPDWSWRRVHDTVLGHGSPAVRYLRMLIGESESA